MGFSWDFGPFIEHPTLGCGFRIRVQLREFSPEGSTGSWGFAAGDPPGRGAIRGFGDAKFVCWAPMRRGQRRATQSATEASGGTKFPICVALPSPSVALRRASVVLKSHYHKHCLCRSERFWRFSVATEGDGSKTPPPTAPDRLPEIVCWGGASFAARRGVCERFPAAA